MSFQRVAIVGTGLIGASLGLALKALPRPPAVVGFDISGDSRRAASRLRAVDRTAGNLVEAVRDAELVVIATPVRSIELVLREIAPFLPPGAVVTDTGSTKAAVVIWAEEFLPPHATFVGGHPMTGKATAGVAEADARLFQGTVYCLTPSTRTDASALDRLVHLVEGIGAVPYFLQPDEHDALVAGVSHLPYVLSSALMESVGTDEGWREMSQLAAGGFATATALAEGDPQMFADIVLTNRQHVVRQLERLLVHLSELKELIAAGDEGVRQWFETAQRLRLEWLASRQGEGEPIPKEELRPPSLLFPSGLGDWLKGRGRG